MEGAATELAANTPSPQVPSGAASEQQALPMGDAPAAPSPVASPVQIEVAPPKSEPPPEPVAPPKKEEPQTLAEQMQEQLRAVEEERARLKELTDRQLDRERLAYLRRIGAKGEMRDTDLLSLAPNVDTTTAEGRASIDEWRQSSGVYFNAREMQTAPDPAVIVKGFKESKHGTFTQDTALKILQKMTGGGKPS